MTRLLMGLTYLAQMQQLLLVRVKRRMAFSTGEFSVRLHRETSNVWPTA